MLLSIFYEQLNDDDDDDDVRFGVRVGPMEFQLKT